MRDGLDNQRGDVGGLRELHLFAGAGGGILGGVLLGHRCVCAVEIDPYCRSVLVARQNDGSLPPFPIWDDIRTFDGRPWRGAVDVVAGGFPCQDISLAGKGVGLDGERSGLWLEMARVIREVGPRFVFVENSPMLTSRGLDRVLGSLAEMGFDAEWGIVAASDVGANHRRERIWIVAYAEGEGLEGRDLRRSAGEIRPGPWESGWPIEREWLTEPRLDRVAHGVAHRVDRLKAIGNGQVPRVAATAWWVLT